MKKRRFWKVLLVVIPVLAGGAAWSAHRYVQKETTPAALVRRLEQSLNCRAEVESASVSLFSFPAKLEVKGLRLLPRDGEVSKTLKDRQPPKKVETVLAVPAFSADLSLPALLSREIRVGQLRLTGAEAYTIRRKNGENTLSAMFSKPPSDPKPEAKPKEEPAPPSSPKSTAKPFAGALAVAKLENAKITIRNEKRKQLVELKDVNLNVANLRYLPPADAGAVAAAAVAPASMPCEVKASLQLTSLDLKDQRRQMDFTLDIASTVTLLAGGRLADGTTLDIQVKSASWIDRIPTLEKLAKKMAKLKGQIGLDLTSFPVSGHMRKGTSIKARIEGGRFLFLEDTHFNFDTCRIKIKAGSWFDPDDQQHEFQGLIAANEEITKNAVQGVDAFLNSKGENLAKIGRETLMQALLDKDGRLSIPFTSTEDIGRPEVTISKSFEKDISNAVGNFAKGLLKDALDGGDGLQNLIDGFRK
ncbi:MAG: hypothetical protein JWM59_1806 [Verrucomicrobiales bacterium]|nr:hypothetical protein [Verrucomicrobiales bacterium]